MTPKTKKQPNGGAVVAAEFGEKPTLLQWGENQ